MLLSILYACVRLLLDLLLVGARPSAAGNLAWPLEEEGRRPSIVLRDRDGTFPAAFDRVFHSEGLRVVRIPIPAPKANAHAER